MLICYYVTKVSEVESMHEKPWSKYRMRWDEMPTIFIDGWCHKRCCLRAANRHFHPIFVINSGMLEM